jgi:hypothetical protein
MGLGVFLLPNLLRERWEPEKAPGRKTGPGSRAKDRFFPGGHRRLDFPKLLYPKAFSKDFQRKLDILFFRKNICFW